MTGAELYTMYRREHAVRGCQTDTWDELEQRDREVWDSLAAHFDAAASEDTKRMNAIEEAASNGCLTTCFEMDGGVHVTLEGVGDEPEAYREQNSVRDGIDAMRKKAGLL